MATPTPRARQVLRLRQATQITVDLKSDWSQQALNVHLQCLPEQGAERRLLAARRYPNDPRWN